MTGVGAVLFSQRMVIPTANPTIRVFTIRTESLLLQSFCVDSSLGFNLSLAELRHHRVVAHRWNDFTFTGADGASLFVEETNHAEPLGHFGQG